MTINVYWSCLEKEWMLSEKPTPVLHDFFKERKLDQKNTLTKLGSCPFFNSDMKNTFSIKSIYNYNFFIEDGNVFSDAYDQDFFNEHVVIRSIDEQFFSFLQRFIFFTEEKSLEMEILPAFLEETDFSKNCIVLPAKIDIGKWFRNLELPFFIKKEFKSFSIKIGEPIYYIKFNTEEKINFIPFRYSEKMKYFQKDSTNILHLKYLKTPKDYYGIFKTKNLIMKEIKESVL
jgi:hypothetical protein